jgi:hypothetical protein
VVELGDANLDLKEQCGAPVREEKDGAVSISIINHVEADMEVQHTLCNAFPRVKVFQNAYVVPAHIAKKAEAIVFTVLSHKIVTSNPPVDEYHFDQVVRVHMPGIADSEGQIFDDIDQRPPDATTLCKSCLSWTSPSPVGLTGRNSVLT